MKIPALENNCGVKIFWKTESDYQENSLSSNEAQIAGKISHLSRKKQFTLGRQALKESLQDAGVKGEISIGKGERGEPIIPSGYCGSISHCTEYRDGRKQAVVAAAVSAKVGHVKLLGLDIEHSARPVQATTYSVVSSESERTWIETGSSTLKTLALISAKETLYKMLYPACLEFFGMLDAELSWKESSSTFDAVLLKDLGTQFKKNQVFEIKIFKKDDLLLTIAWI